jgi:hypothetical protein
MNEETNRSNLKRIAQKIYKKRTDWLTENNTIKNSSIDSFLMFAFHETGDSSFYPYWSNLEFNNLDHFLLLFVVMTTILIA